jgi:RNase P subunit RPR2
VCRKCHAPHRFGENARVRIKHGQRIITCLECSSIRRFGGGPKSHRRQ